jgi:hypothetical protein
MSESSGVVVALVDRRWCSTFDLPLAVSVASSGVRDRSSGARVAIALAPVAGPPSAGRLGACYRSRGEIEVEDYVRDHW